MALDVPVTATRAGGYRDVIIDGENGLLFNDRDIQGIATAILKLVSDETVREKCIRNGYTTAFETFSMDRTLDAYEQLYTRLIQKCR